MTPFDTWFRTQNTTTALSDTTTGSKRIRRFGATSLIALAIAGGTVGGGAVGAAVTAQVVAPRQPRRPLSAPSLSRR